MQSKKTSLLRSFGAISLPTGLSRILGFIRDILLAGLFGTSLQAQAFVVAYRLPNLFRELVAEGAVTSAIVPVLSAYRARGDEKEFWHVAQALLARVLAVLALIAAAGTFFAEPIIRVVAPGFVQTPELFELTVRLTRILFPFIFLVGVWAYFMGVLNSLRRFAAPALGPAILNLCMIGACLFFVPYNEPGILAVVYAVLIGGVIQVAVQLPPAFKQGFRLRLHWKHKATADMMRLFAPRLFGAAAYQANVLVHTMLASLSGIVGVGAVAALYFANRLINLPLGLFGTASAQASLPVLAEFAEHRQWEEFEQTLLRVSRSVLCIMLPASAGLIALSYPIVMVLFQRGEFDAHSTSLTVAAVGFYAIGLWAYALGKVYTNAFYACKDTRTPVRLSVEAVGLNIFLSVALMFPMRISGLALAASIANAWLVWRLLRAMEGRLEKRLIHALLQPLGKIGFAALAMGVWAWGVWTFLHAAVLPVVALIIAIVSSMAVYTLLCWWLRVEEWQWLLRRILKR